MQQPHSFCPSDVDLFRILVKKETGEPLQETGEPLPPGLIEEREIYSEEPWKIFDSGSASHRTFYVFTTLRKRGRYFQRMAGDGTWTQQHKKDIKDIHGKLLGHRRYFYFNRINCLSATSGHWIMYEFSMLDEMCVVCKIIYRKGNSEGYPEDYPEGEKKSKEKPIIIPDDEPGQSNDENRQQKKLCLGNDHGDRTNAIYDSTAALPSSTVDQAQAAASQAISSDNTYAVTPQVSPGVAAGVYYPAVPGPSGDANANSLSPMATTTMQRSSNERMKGRMITELDVVVHSGNNSKSISPPLMEEGNHTNLLTRASLPPTTATTTTMSPQPVHTLNSLSTTAGPKPVTMQRDTLSGQTWDLTSLHQQRSAAEPQEQDVEVPLEWADQFINISN